MGEIRLFLHLFQCGAYNNNNNVFDFHKRDQRCWGYIEGRNQSAGNARRNKIVLSRKNNLLKVGDVLPHNTRQSGGCPKDVNFGHWSYPLDVG